ncbi:Tigger transposable element-derived protein 2 [Trichinella sp. T9]|nr:Tigger transposable element-derived protein 2 [Trichinella sp. T9]
MRGMCTIRKRKVLSLKQKLEVCKRVDSSVLFRKIAEDLGVGMSIIPDICRSQCHLSNFNMDTSNSCSSRKSLKKASNNALDSEIYMWFLRKLALDQPISGPICQEKALVFSTKLDVDNLFNQFLMANKY